LFVGTAKPELHRRFGADAGEIDSAVAGTRNSGDVGIQGLVKKNANVSIGGRSGQADGQ
jgi:hypothetical protein